MNNPHLYNHNGRGGRGRGRGGGGYVNRGGHRGPRESAREKKPIEITPYECPRDSDGNALIVPMRFEIIKLDGTNAQTKRELKRFFLDKLIEAARDCSVEMETKNEELEVTETPVEGMEYSRWVAHFKVSCCNWQANLSQFGNRFLQLSSSTREWERIRHDVPTSFPVYINRRQVNSSREWIKMTRQYEMPILYTHSQVIYPLRLINTHIHVPLRRIKFGSFINCGSIGVHWCIEGGVGTQGDEEDGYTFYKEVDASFEYDRRQITVSFHNREVDPDDLEKRQILANYKLTVNMGSIRKIGFDQVELDNETRRRSIVLHIDYPPKIQVRFKKETENGNANGRQRNGYNSHSAVSPQGNNGNSQGKNCQWKKFEHSLQIRRGLYPGETSHVTALHESKILVLELDNECIGERLVPKPSTIDHFVFDILSRLRHKTGKAVEFTSYDQENLIEGTCRKYDEYGHCRLFEVVPYEVTPDIDDHVKECIKNAATKMSLRSDTSVYNRVHNAPRIQLKMFRLRAVFEGLLQRGMDIRCQLLCNWEYWYCFVQLVCDKYVADEQKTLAVMENLLSIVAEGRPHCTVINLFNKEWEDTRRSHGRTTVFTEEEKKQGFTRVMKFVKTPARLIFVGYETIMANRVLNQHSKNGTEIIRVSFRDDSGEYMREMSCGTTIIHNTMREVLLEDGIRFAGRRYVWLGNSNSQLRDHGIYMYHEEDINGRTQMHGHKSAREIRHKLGKFHQLSCIPKWLARQGQCFTQAKASNNMLSIDEVGVVHDFIGGMADVEKLKPYCFSDGVGTISFALADKLSKEHSLPRIASAFQIRHKGQKGLVVVDPSIDDRNELNKKLGKNTEMQVFVRPSMDKFEVDDAVAEKSDKTNLEIVKYSMASSLYLNRPMLNILSQVAEDQSSECYASMSNRIQDLLDSMLRNTMQSLYMEEKAIEAIKEMSFPFAMEVFNLSSSLKFTCEPFIRSLLTANARYVLNRQLSKMQIRIPSQYGRSMFGVVDTTGILQYGQCFCQYSTSTSKHMSKSRSRRNGVDGAIILTGPVMITKNPCIEKGDVRRFEAIDVPGLRHLVDVVVFPKHGPRPHPDEMAGSDLDGDEYSLIWDPQMLFDHNEEASLFPVEEGVDKWPIEKIGGVVNVEACERRLADFYIEAVTQEQIGVLSNAHLATSDFFGLENPASRSLARKISQALDFQKNGVRPDKMTTQPDKDPNDPHRVIPPEKAARKPDYMEKMRDAGYESRGIMGDIYREIKKYQTAIDLGEDQLDMIVADESFNLPGWKCYESVVKREMDSYNHGIRSLMENYGIMSEGEIMSGSILSIKNRISEKEADDMNLYNTNQVIEDKVKREITAARESFFDSLIHWQTELDQVENKRRDVDKDSILCRIVRSSTNNIDKIRLKGAAAYNVCYAAANQQLQNGDQSSLILSYPWIVYDVLMDIKMRPDERIVRVLPQEVREHSNEPLAIVMSDFIDKYCAVPNADEYEKFKRRFDPDSIIGRSINENEGLARASFVLTRWSSYIGLNEKSRFTHEHLIGLFILFGLGEVNVRGTRRRYIQRPTGEQRVHLKKGEHLLKFIDYIASREFRTRDHISFNDVLPGVLTRGTWIPFSELCIPAYLNLVTTHRLSLPMDKEEAEVLRVATAIKEYEPRKMELPCEVIRDRLEEVRTLLLRASGCQDIQLRQMGSTSECFVSALGTSANFKKLSELVVSPAPSRDLASHRQHFTEVPLLVFERLERAASGYTTNCVEGLYTNFD